MMIAFGLVESRRKSTVQHDLLAFVHNYEKAKGPVETWEQGGLGTMALSSSSLVYSFLDTRRPLPRTYLVRHVSRGSTAHKI